VKNLSGQAAIVGFGDSYSTNEEGKDPIRLATEVIVMARKETRLKKEDTRGLLASRSPLADQRPQWNNAQTWWPW